MGGRFAPESTQQRNRDNNPAVHLSVLQKLCLYAKEKEKNNSFLIPTVS